MSANCNRIEDPEVYSLLNDVTKRIDHIRQLLEVKKLDASGRFKCYVANLIDNLEFQLNDGSLVVHDDAEESKLSNH